ncbi:fibronectin type III domain-containing protein [Melioribacter sp. OK-6-Me]|uniref:fibronectin type III domain-containing protein n=1 Tax=unclassified Melioribacter TaxID=2627329 RepID=UPI003ED8837B
MRSCKNILFSITILLTVACRENEPTQPGGESIPPLPPIKFGVYSAFDGLVGLSWSKNNEPDIDGYLVFRSINDTSNFINIAFTSNNYYIDRNLDYDSTYFYRIAAKDIYGNISNFSNTVSARPLNIFPPYNPVYLFVYGYNRAGKPEIEVSWSPAYDSDISHYEIFRDTVDNFSINNHSPIKASSNNYFLDTNSIELLKKYYYKIVSVDKGGLKSNGTDAVSDYVLNAPILLYPEDNSTVIWLDKFVFKAASAPASYDLIIQTSENGGMINSISLFDVKPDTIYTVKADKIYLKPYIKYYWKIISYTKDKRPNSISKTFSFFYNPVQN